MQKRDQAMEHQEDYARNYSTKTHSTDPNHEQDKIGIKLTTKNLVYERDSHTTTVIYLPSFDY
jgi:hypothetical protein